MCKFGCESGYSTPGPGKGAADDVVVFMPKAGSLRMDSDFASVLGCFGRGDVGRDDHGWAMGMLWCDGEAKVDYELGTKMTPKLEEETVLGTEAYEYRDSRRIGR
ncbi:hypothetical protein GALMADRAFT_1212095 [Galerina marginata CBS 339.88]|uniref:Uncharacterized protein n=1 Tax=Galerina marginata (strain CBS 339.88) TaxID=685588 RepID=A0A067S7U3_GALM3|nr:hypothetical protein GALMADRAFT_1212095 [Galerina marginata CBS 339.88]